jgi:hypothetical protein
VNEIQSEQDRQFSSGKTERQFMNFKREEKQKQIELFPGQMDNKLPRTWCAFEIVPSDDSYE